MAALALDDIERAIREHDPLLGELLVRYLAEEDPEPGVAEIATAVDEEHAPEVPEGAWTHDRLAEELSPSGLRGKTPTERKLARREAFSAAEGSTWAPPRLRLAPLLLALYESGDDAGREALTQVFLEGRLGWGAWKAAKAIYKLAEARHDAAMFGVLACRFDTLDAGDTRGEVGAGTRIYLYRRAWRYLRLLGRAVPDLYVTFAVEVLRHYPPDDLGTWVSSHVFSAYPDAWKASPAPLLRLLGLAGNDRVCAFAIKTLRQHHALALRAVEPAWLARLGARPIGSLHGFVVGLMKDNPELHASRLREVGLHDVVVGFLKSPDAEARSYALDYARAHAPDLSIDFLLELLLTGHKPVIAFAASRIEPLLPTLPLPVLGRLIGHDATRAAASARFSAAHRPSELSAEQFADLFFGGDPTRAFVSKLFADAGVPIPTAFWRAVATDPRRERRSLRIVLGELGKRPGAEIGARWIQDALSDDDLSGAAVQWLQAGKLSGDELDVEWVKSLVARAKHRDLALHLLGDRALVRPARIGVSWLLELQRSSDPELHAFATAQLLQNFAPADFVADGLQGLDLLWDLASGRRRPEAVREFAATYLRLHHPDIGPHHGELKALGVTPRLTHADYPLARVRPLFDDERADVRRLAVAVAREEIARWGEAELLYELAGSRHREPRALGCELLLAAAAEAPRTPPARSSPPSPLFSLPAQPSAGASDAVPAAWIEGPPLFALAESRHRATREAALTVVGKLYDRVGAPERLAWLMESPERDVRLFAVRLFWDRHRPRPGPARTPFDDVGALRQFLRTVLFGLPPGRSEGRAGSGPASKNAPLPQRPLPASVAKKRLVEAIRDLGVEQLEFARIAAPVLTEFTASEAKGEWQACVAALAAMTSAHGELRP